jgi:hypothetical protein
MERAGPISTNQGMFARGQRRLGSEPGLEKPYRAPAWGLTRDPLPPDPDRLRLVRTAIITAGQGAVVGRARVVGARFPAAQLRERTARHHLLASAKAARPEVSAATPYRLERDPRNDTWVC